MCTGQHQTLLLITLLSRAHLALTSHINNNKPSNTFHCLLLETFDKCRKIASNPSAEKQDDWYTTSV